MATNTARPFLHSFLSPTHDPQTSSPLFKLPAELRAIIYRFVFVGTVLLATCSESGDDERISLKETHFSVLHTCRLTRAEAATVLYRSALLKFDSAALLYDARSFMNTDLAKYIKRIYIGLALSLIPLLKGVFREKFSNLKTLTVDIGFSFDNQQEKVDGGGSLEKCIQKVLDNQAQRNLKYREICANMFLRREVSPVDRPSWSLAAIDYNQGDKVFLRINIHGDQVRSSSSSQDDVQKNDVNQFGTAELASATEMRRFLSYEDELA